MDLLKGLAQRLFLGFSLFLLLYVIFLPFFYLVSFQDVAAAWKFVLLFLAVSIFLGHFFTNYRLPLLAGVSRAFLSLLSGIYGHFLEQAAKYFCADNETNPFTAVVAIRISDGIEILGFSTNSSPDKRTVFIPTSPKPTSGIILRVHPDFVQDTTISKEDLLRYILTSGAFVIKTWTDSPENIH